MHSPKFVHEADPEALAALNGITHPLVGREMATRMAAQAATDNIVVLDIPLLAERGRGAYPVAGVIVVDNNGPTITSVSGM